VAGNLQTLPALLFPKVWKDRDYANLIQNRILCPWFMGSSQPRSHKIKPEPYFVVCRNSRGNFAPGDHLEKLKELKL